MTNDRIVLLKQAGIGFTQPDDAEFGLLMLDKFLHALEPEANRPEAIILYTEGAKLATHDSPCLLPLQLLQGLGVKIYVCATCLKHYGYTAEDSVFEVSDMGHITNMLVNAKQVISF